jgi:hypothetical protein
MSGRFTNLIVGAMVLGIVVGYGLHTNLTPEETRTIAGYFSIITDVFHPHRRHRPHGRFQPG